MFKLIVAGIDKKYFEGEVVSLTADLEEGQVTVLTNHAPLLGKIKKGGEIFIKTENDKHGFELNEGGVLEVSNNMANVLIYPETKNAS